MTLEFRKVFQNVEHEKFPALVEINQSFYLFPNRSPPVHIPIIFTEQFKQQQIKSLYWNCN